MLNKRIILWLIIALLCITSIAFAQKEDIKEYKVQQGDTLWDISKKETNDPFLWPRIWKENPEIANPDKLQPGQIIKIPLYLMSKDAQKEISLAEEPFVESLDKESLKEAPVQKGEAVPMKLKPLVDANLYVSSGYIAKSMNELGRVAGSPSKRNLFGTNDLIYLNTKEPVRVGARFYIVRKKEIIHPVNKSRVGDLVQIVGVAEVIVIKQGEIVAKILKSYEDIILGNWLIAYTDMPPPVVSKPYRKPNIQAYIVAARGMNQNNAMFNIVYLDKGKDAGLEVGDVLRAISVEKQLEGFTVAEHKYPHGLVQVLKVHDNTSVAIIRQSLDSILPGYMVIQYD